MERTILHSFFVFITVYGILNGYCFWKLSRWLRLRLPARLAFAAAVVALTFGEVFIKGFQRLEWPWAVRGFALAAYFWMAFLLWFNLLGGLVDGWNIALRLARRVRPAAARWAIPFRPGMAATLGLVGAIMLYSLAEAQWIRVVEVHVRSPRFHGPPLRILQISDVHLGLVERGHRVGEIIGLVERTRPDLLISTGDLLDGSGVNMAPLGKRLAALHPPLGKIAITGNHEFYNGIRKSVAFHEAAGFRMLRGTSATLAGGRLRLAGIDDPTGRRLGGYRPADEAALLGPPRADCFTILLKHQPFLNEGSLGRFDLMLSGHTHQGQILPFGLLLLGAYYPYFTGTHALPEGGVLHVSRGTGTWGPPMRLGAPPEVTLITLEAEANPSSSTRATYRPIQ